MLKDNGVMTLTFRGHVTSSVTWPFDSRWPTSYGWSIATMHLSGTVMEIWRLKDMYTDTQTHGTMDTHTDKTTNLIISSNVHYCLHMAEITKLNNSI